MKSADQLVSEAKFDTNHEWTSMLTRDLAEEITGRRISLDQWEDLREMLDNTVFDTVMGLSEEW